SKVWGDWTLELKLVNVQSNETAREAKVSWNGLAGGWTSAGWESGSKENAIKNMVREEFLPITQVIYDYERIPRSVELQPEKRVIGSDEEMLIGVEKIHDHQGRVSRPWQRIVVEVKEGELLNGTPLEPAGGSKRYAFMVGDGLLEVRYKSPSKCELKTEEVKVYNSCTWGQTPVPVPMTTTASAQEIGSTEFEIVCAEGVLEYIDYVDRSGDDSCHVEDTSDFLDFELSPTKDSCIYKIKGNSSPQKTRKQKCEDTKGNPGCPHKVVSWREYERQTRISGGVVEFRDLNRGPFRPIVEYRNRYTRCESLRTDCYGNEEFRKQVCTGTDALKGANSVSDDGWVTAGPQLWMQFQDGQKSRHFGLHGQGLNYILHIDEEPFRQLEQGCLDSMR
ncbi:MAG: hypothetical protein P8Z31_06180, partial [Gammaproteobacteria bacterium]